MNEDEGAALHTWEKLHVSHIDWIWGQSKSTWFMVSSALLQTGQISSSTTCLFLSSAFVASQAWEARHKKCLSLGGTWRPHNSFHQLLLFLFNVEVRILFFLKHQRGGLVGGPIRTVLHNYNRLLHLELGMNRKTWGRDLYLTYRQRNSQGARGQSQSK